MADIQQLPPPFTSWNAASPAHLIWQSAVSAQLIEQSPAQVTWQVEFALHEMLPLAPSVIEQLAPSLQSTLQESPHAPAQVDCAAQPRVQLAPQVWVETSQLAPAMQAQVVPVHTGAGLVETPPQAFTVMPSTTTIEKRDAMAIAALHLFVIDLEVPPARSDQAAVTWR